MPQPKKKRLCVKGEGSNGSANASDQGSNHKTVTKQEIATKAVTVIEDYARTTTESGTGQHQLTAATAGETRTLDYDGNYSDISIKLEGCTLTETTRSGADKHNLSAEGSQSQEDDDSNLSDIQIKLQGYTLIVRKEKTIIETQWKRKLRELEIRKNELDKGEKELKIREKELDKREDELKKREEEFKIKMRQRHEGCNCYSCDECGKKLTRLVDLKSHKMTHTGEQPFKCNLCGNFFRLKQTLLKHHRKKRKCIEIQGRKVEKKPTKTMEIVSDEEEIEEHEIPFLETPNNTNDDDELYSNSNDDDDDEAALGLLTPDRIS